MFKQYVCSIALICALTQVTGCSKATETASESSIDPNVMSGVAATGAPVSSAKVKIKGSDGTIVEDETSTDGSYSVNVSTLTEPYLVQVEAPSGEKYISVASKSALAEGKKINVTPLTHTIVANVFEKADADDLFENFQTEASKYSDSKLEGQKVVLFNKLVAAGLIGTGGVVDSSVDLLNGVLLAGTSKGIDGLLDVLDINTGATTGIEIKLKGEGAPFITDVVTVANDVLPAPIAPSLISGSITQLSMLDVIRKRMIDFSLLYSSKVACNGAPLDDGGACDVDTIESDLSGYFHPDFNDNGLNKSQGVWDWICVVEDNDSRVTTKSECLSSGEVFFENVVFKDITLINYNKDTGVALVNFNLYFNGKLEGSEDFLMKLDSADNKFKLLGNKKSFRYWIETESIHRSQYVRSTHVDNGTPVVTSEETNVFEVSLNMWFGSAASHTFSGDEEFTMTSAAGHEIFGESASKTIYLVKGPTYDKNDVCTEGVVFSTRSNPYVSSSYVNGVEVKTNKNYDQACNGESDNACNCQSGYFDWENQKIAFTA